MFQPILKHYYLKPYFIHMPLVFSQCHFSVSGSHPGGHITVNCPVSLSPLDCDSFSNSLAFDDGQCWELLRYIIKCLSNGICPTKSGLLVLGVREITEVKYHFHHTRSGILTTYMIYDLVLTLVSCLSQCLQVQLLHHEVTLPAPFTLHFLEGGHCVAHVVDSFVSLPFDGVSAYFPGFLLQEEICLFSPI